MLYTLLFIRTILPEQVPHFLQRIKNIIKAVPGWNMHITKTKYQFLCKAYTLLTNLSKKVYIYHISTIYDRFAGLVFKGLIPLQAFSCQWSAYLIGTKSSWVRIFVKLSQTCPIYFNDKIR